MSAIKDLRQTHQMTETSFGGDADGFAVIANADPPPAHERGEIQQQSGSSADGPLRAKQPGLMARIGRGVKSAVGGAIGGAINMFAGPSQDTDLDFVERCKKASKKLTKLHSKHGEAVFPDKALQALIRTNEMLDLKDICISVFGQHNCGKSTLLNALIGEELLPVYDMSETSVKIKVQHDSNIHQGACVQNCPNQYHGYRQLQPKSCPKLQVTFKRSKKEFEVKGAEAIYDYLTELNAKIRQADHEPPIVVLKVNIPLLAGRVPPGWTVSLVDNPGFGEAKEHVVQLADASLVTSSAYIYLLQTENIGGTEAAGFFKELTGKDKTALRDGRLVVGVTKFDTVYSNKSRKRGRRAAPTTVEKVRENLITSIKDATGTVISDDTIIPLCGEWAMAASKLASCLISDPIDEKQKKLAIEEVAEALEKYPYLSLPGGQEQSPKDAIKSLQPMALIDHMERASGVTDLKARIHYVVGNACVKVWATKIISEFQNYLEAGEKGIEGRCTYLSDTIAEKGTDYRKGQDLYDEIMSSRENIKRTAPRRKKRETSLWKEFETSYHKDMEQSKPQEEGKMKVRDLVKEFRDKCQTRITSKNFSPADFENSIHEFLDDSGPKLQRVFDSSCGFWNVQSVLMKHIGYMIEDVTKLRSNARLLCKMGPEEVIEPHRRGTMSESEGRALSAPNLADIKLKVKIPSVSLRWWEKIIKFFRISLHGNVSSEIDQEKDEESERDDKLNEESSGLPGSPGASLGNQTSAIPEERGDNSDESDSESDDECDKHENIFTGVDLNNVSSNQDPSSLTLESESITSHCSSTSTAEDEPDGGGSNKQGPSKRVNSYRKWTQELEDAICELQQNMEIECDNYFEDIMPTAIKFFYKDYSRRTHDRLETFDKDFSGPLEQEHRRLKELKSDIDSLQKDYYELQAKKIDIKKLAQQLFDAYSAEFAGHLSGNTIIQ